jgi:nucleolar protein 53
MGIPKTSRKGKKAWRSNISTADVDNFFVQADKDARSGGPLTDVSSDYLFFLDKSKDYSIKRKIEKHRSKVLRYESILQNNPFTNPIPTSKKKKHPSKTKPPPTKTSSLKPAQSDQKVTDALFDIWDDKGNSNGKVEEGQEKKHLKWKPKKSVIPAVEVELPGCSFNPPFEAHQDALAVAVADEMQKIYKKELEPLPVPSRVPADAVAVDEEDMCFLDVDDGMDENLDANDDECDVSNLGQRPLKIRKLTRSELNRKARRKEQLKIEEEKRMREKFKKDVECLPDMIKDIEKEEEERERKRLRRAVAKQERLAKGPPRLGRSKFQPEPLQVLLSEEITGSIRKLKGCCTLAKDRFKSLQKRGYFAPRQHSRRKRRM